MLKLLTSAAVLVAATPALAITPGQKDGDEVRMVLHTHDLDLSTLEGTRMLKHRINVAAKKACGPVDYTDRAAVATIEDCVQSLKRSAYEAVVG